MNEVLIPRFISVLITPNPVDCGAMVTFAVEVVDAAVILDTELRYSGEFYSGET